MSEGLGKIIQRIERSKIIAWEPQKELLARIDDIKRGFHSQEQDITLSEMQGKYKTEKPEEAETTGLVLAKKHVLAQHTDSLEAIRTELGLADARDQILKEIEERIDFDKGVERLLNYLNNEGRELAKKHGIRKAKGLEDIAKVMPEISSAEIAWISTLQTIPTVYFHTEYGVPTIMDFDIEGIEYGFDGHNGWELLRENTMDAYTAAGITGKTQNTQFIKFKPEFEKAFRALMMLNLSDQTVYNKLMEGYRHQALIKGDGKLKRAIAEEKKELEGRLCESLSHEEILEIEEELKKRISNKHVYDLSRENVCSEQDLVTLIGLLERAPQSFKKESKFEGYIIPYGKGVKILDQTGAQVEYIAYEEYLQIEAQEHIYYSTQDISKTNQLANFLFNHYSEMLETKLNNHPELPLDRLRDTFRTVYGTIIPQRAVKTITTNKNSHFHAFLQSTGTESTMVEYTLKTGIRELETLLETLDKLPRKIVPEIRQINRQYLCEDAEELIIGGMVTFGAYNSETKTITLYTPENESFSKLKPIDLQIMKDAYAHEIGHGVYRSLTPEQQKEWSRISKACLPLEEEMKKHFLYDIEVMREIYTYEDGSTNMMSLIRSHMGLIEEDFAEHFAAYLNHGEEFRNGPKELQEKYEYFNKLIEEEYHDTPLMTLIQLQKWRIKKKRKKELEPIVAAQNNKNKRREQESREHREEIIPSYELLQGDVEKEEIDHIYGREDKVHEYILREIKCYIPQHYDITQVDPEEFETRLEESAEEAARYLRGRYELDEEDTTEFTGILKEQLEQMEEDRKKFYELL